MNGVTLNLLVKRGMWMHSYTLFDTLRVISFVHNHAKITDTSSGRNIDVWKNCLLIIGGTITKASVRHAL